MGKCKDCCYWEKDSDSQGKCKLASSANGMANYALANRDGDGELLATAYDYESYAAYLETNAEYGCVQFEFQKQMSSQHQIEGDLTTPTQEIKLVLDVSVPDTELELEIAMRYLHRQVVVFLAGPQHHVSSGLCYSYYLLQTVHSRYMDVVGKPGEKYPTYHQLVADQNQAQAEGVGAATQALGPVGGGGTGKGMGQEGRNIG